MRVADGQQIKRTTAAKRFVTMNLEQYRQERGYSYQQLADFLDLPQAKTARAYALGVESPSPERLQTILDRTGGQVSVLAMHEQRMAHIRANGGTRNSTAIDCSRDSGWTR